MLNVILIISAFKVFIHRFTQGVGEAQALPCLLLFVLYMPPLILNHKFCLFKNHTLKQRGGGEPGDEASREANPVEKYIRGMHEVRGGDQQLAKIIKIYCLSALA